MRYLIGLLLLSMSCAQPVPEKVAAAKSIPELKQQLEAILKSENVPGLSVAIVERGKDAWAEGIGVADVTEKTPVTAQTRFRIGSISKAFASLSLLKLANEGKLSLMDSVRKLVPEVWFENAWEKTNPVLVVDLVEHTTGWDDMHFREYAKDDVKISLRDAFDYDHSSRISRWRPGTRYAYCNSGPAVAAYIVEKVSGQSYEDYVEKNFFDPIGMDGATFFEPASDFTKLYFSDATTPVPYWNVIYRPSGAINASASDMAAYLQLYLTRGQARGVPIVPETAINRMEVPVRTWAAQDGLRVGYGLGNYATVRDGFVYHGHSGGLTGGLSELAYLPQAGVGYFFSINAASVGAVKKIGERIRAFITREIAKPVVPQAAPLPANFSDYEGWYVFDSSRVEAFRFLERLAGLVYIRSDEGKMMLSTWTGQQTSFVPVIAGQFRALTENEAPEPVATSILIQPNEEGRFIQVGDGLQTLKQIPTWLAWLQLVLMGWFILAFNSTLLYAPFWLVGGLVKKWRRPQERWMRVWPLIAVLSVFLFVIAYQIAEEDLIRAFGEITVPSFLCFASTILFAFACVASAYALFQAKGARRFVRWHATFVTMGLCIGALYLAYWGVIGYRPWA